MAVITYRLLLEKRRKGWVRNNWRVLTTKEKALFAASLAYTKPKRTIVEPRLVQLLEELFGKLLETRGLRILKQGQAKAASLLQRLEQLRVASWLVGLKDWLQDPAYIFWLGAVG